MTEVTAARTFVVARNPEPGSRLPYLISLPLPDGPLVLKAREPWPRTASTYCHRTDNRWPNDAEVLEHVQPGFVVERLAAVQVRYPSVAVLFCETRPLAEDWTFRFLGAALAQAHAERSAGRP